MFILVYSLYTEIYTLWVAEVVWDYISSGGGGDGKKAFNKLFRNICEGWGKKRTGKVSTGGFNISMDFSSLSPHSWKYRGGFPHLGNGHADGSDGL